VTRIKTFVNDELKRWQHYAAECVYAWYA